jgi:hypothetical protein
MSLRRLALHDTFAEIHESCVALTRIENQILQQFIIDNWPTVGFSQVQVDFRLSGTVTSGRLFKENGSPYTRFGVS